MDLNVPEDVLNVETRIGIVNLGLISLCCKSRIDTHSTPQALNSSPMVAELFIKPITTVFILV